MPAWPFFDAGFVWKWRFLGMRVEMFCVNALPLLMTAVGWHWRKV